MEREGNDPVVAPLPTPPSYLVLHKLKQWDECRIHAHNNPDSNDQSARLELQVVRKQLFTMLTTLRHSIPNFQHDPTYDPNLHKESAPRVDRFLAAHSCYGKEWRKMGFQPGASAGASSPPNSSERRVRPKLGIMQIRSLAAQTTVTILAELGLPCAIFGSMACKLYGNQRIPNDVDILVLPPPERASITQEEIKVLIAQHASPNYHFVLKPARDPSATYKVLHFIAKPRPSTTVISRVATNDEDDDDDNSIAPEFPIPIRIPRQSSSKVDILLPGIMHLPALPTSMITQLHSLPLVPFPVLLLQKLQGWADHSAATEARYRRKIGEDSRDLEWCLSSKTVNRHLLNKNVRNGGSGSVKERFLKRVWSDRTMFSEEFEALSRVRVREFCEVYTGLREAWKAIGFDV